VNSISFHVIFNMAAATVALCPPKPEVLISLELWQIALQFKHQIQVFNYDKFKKVLADDGDNYQLQYSITVLFSVTHFQCTCIYAIEMPKEQFLLLCVTVTNVLTYRKSVNITDILCQCMGYFLSGDIYSVTRDISTSGVGGHIAIFGCWLSSQLFANTFFEIVKTPDLHRDFLSSFSVVGDKAVKPQISEG